MIARVGSPAPIAQASAQAVARAAAEVRAGEIIAFPTETLYGLAALALDALAVERLVAIKGRQVSQPIALLVADRRMLEEVVVHVPERARALMASYWPGALTLVLPARPGLPAALVNSRGGVGVRVSADPVAQGLVARVGAPITATSANRAGEAPATSAEAAARIGGVALVLDDGPRAGAPSTVVELMADELVVLRRGAVEVVLGGGPAGER